MTPLRPARHWLTLSTLYFIVFLNSFGYFLIIPVLVNIVTVPHGIIPNHLSQTLGDYLFSIVLGAGSLAGLFFAPLLGRLSDQIGRRKILIACTVLTLISFILPILAIASASITLFILGNVINGIASNNQPIAQAAISDISPNRQKKALRFSIDTCVITAAMTLGPVAGACLSDPGIVSGFNNTTPFLAAGILTFISLLVLWFRLPETNTHLQKKPHLTVSAFSDILKAPTSLLRLLLVFFLTQSAWAQYYQYSYLYLTETLHFTNHHLSLYTAFIGLCISVGLIVIYPLWLKLQPNALRQMASLCILMSAISMGVLALYPIIWVQWVAMVPLAFGIGMYFPSLLTLFSHYSADTDQGWIMSVCGGSLGLAWLITGFTAISLSHFNTKAPIGVAALMLLIAWMIMRYDAKRVRDVLH